MGDKPKLSAKGTAKYAQKSVKHPVFFWILARDALLRTLNYRINCEKQNTFTLQTTKVSLSCFDDKRFFLLSGVDTLPFGIIPTEKMQCSGKLVRKLNGEMMYWARNRRKRRERFTLIKQTISKYRYFHLLLRTLSKSNHRWKNFLMWSLL